MNILISNGSPDPLQHAQLETRLDQLEQVLTGQGHSVTRLNLRELDLRGCNGCWGCWVKTPGECVQPDDGPRLRQAVIQADFHLMAAPLRMGFPAALLKTALDKCLPLIHPYLAVVNGECHHQSRYARYPRIGLLVEAEPALSPEQQASDLALVSEIFSRAALNMKSSLAFAMLADQPAEALAAAVCAAPSEAGLAYRVGLAPIPGQQINPASRLTVFNGSPRGEKSNTLLMLGHFLRGFESLLGKTIQVYNLNRLNDRALFKAAYGEAECVLLAFPLYVDAMPGQVKRFIEDLESCTGRAANPPMGFLVQSGFPEALHSRYVERYLERLAARLGAPYLGTLLRGGVEGIQIQPEKANAGMFKTLYQLGRSFGESGRFDPALLAKLAGRERFKANQLPVIKLMARLPILNFYWDMQLKANKAFDRRNARPYSQ